MPDSSSQEPQNDESEASVDLSQLKSFSFGTQWSEASKSSAPAERDRGRGGPRGSQRPDRRQGGAPPRKDRRPQRPQRVFEGQGGEGAPRQQGEERQDRGDRGQGRGRQHHGHAHPPFRPYESPVFDVCFYPDDACFSAIIKAMRANHLTYELFHVAKLFMEKPDRFIASITRKAAQGEKPEKVFVCADDGIPFATEEEVLTHALNHHADKYFTIEEIEVDPPTGNFTFVNRCPFTKELLGPANYHKYEDALRKHHQTRLPNMPFEKLQSSIETVRDEAVVNEWLESQKKATRYTAKHTPEGEEPKAFRSLEEAAGYLRSTAKAKLVKQVNFARVSGAILENCKDTEAYKAMDGERARQQRFPLDTANAIRGRMRREKFSIYKKGAKGVTYVCATKRNFRTPGQVMAPDLDRIIRFLEAHPLTKAKEFLPKIEQWLKEQSPDAAVDEKKLQRDLHWLIADGYVSHFEDDSLFAQPVLETGGAEHGDKPAGGSRKEENPAGAGSSKPKEERHPESPAADASTPASEVEGEAPQVVEVPESVEEAPAPEEVVAKPEKLEEAAAAATSDQTDAPAPVESSESSGSEAPDAQPGQPLAASEDKPKE